MCQTFYDSNRFIKTTHINAGHEPNNSIQCHQWYLIIIIMMMIIYFLTFFYLENVENVRNLWETGSMTILPCSHVVIRYTIPETDLFTHL